MLGRTLSDLKQKFVRKNSVAATQQHVEPAARRRSVSTVEVLQNKYGIPSTVNVDELQPPTHWMTRKSQTAEETQKPPLASPEELDEETAAGAGPPPLVCRPNPCYEYADRHMLSEMESDEEYIPASEDQPEEPVVSSLVLQPPAATSSSRRSSAEVTQSKKCYKVALELLTTERTYVKILHLLDQEFRVRVDKENSVQKMFPSNSFNRFFDNISSLYQLHQHLLPRLESCLLNWDEDPRIGHVMKEFSPFLKMYVEYVEKYGKASALIESHRAKNPRFAGVIKQVEELEACANLPIQHHLIGPIQRIPRYRLLLEAYLEGLPSDSKDRQQSEEALSIVSDAAEHSNAAMRRIAGYAELVTVEEQINGIVDLYSTTRVLLKEGNFTRISSRTSEPQDCQMFLFNDMMLLCSVRALASKLISTAPYQLRAKLDLSKTEVSEGGDLESGHSFYLMHDAKIIELYAKSPYEKNDWIQAILTAKDNTQEHDAFRILNMPASAPAILSGYLNLRLSEKKEWATRWFSLRSNSVLYSYGKMSDEQAQTAAPIAGSEVSMFDEFESSTFLSTVPPVDRPRAFHIGRGKMKFLFVAPSKEAAANWFDRLRQCVKTTKTKEY